MHRGPQVFPRGSKSAWSAHLDLIFPLGAFSFLFLCFFFGLVAFVLFSFKAVFVATGGCDEARFQPHSGIAFEARGD
jgi:hypothetical protein